MKQRSPHFQLLGDVVESLDVADIPDWRVLENDKRALDAIDLRSDTLGELRRRGIVTLSGLLAKSAADLIGPGFRRGRVNEVETKLAKTGHRLKEK